MTGSSTPRVSPREIADLLAWARVLITAGPAANPAEQAAYLAAKADLLERITHHHAESGAEPAAGREGR
jgi:hypothetical protein